ncbi:hypothetical protein [Roseibacillus persicicus]|uniref:Uncharacterized protein n=1 Tax=Roseibacillus persicicus TaxID=454148 RepID=A0A918TFW4_9BACT|nr:hypothetical protein [Roseibacillus persicicus]GHC46528.1 hypothetical protein GCM10007100_10200 [Roseibacillus persicicus]
MRRRDKGSILDDASGLMAPGGSQAWSIYGLGLVLPLLIFAYAGKSFLLRESFYLSSRGIVELYGDSARWMAAFYLGIALFVHARWWWGGKGYEQAHHTLMGVACLFFIGGYFGASVCALAGV